MKLKAVVHLAVDVVYHLDDNEKSLKVLAAEQVPRAIDHAIAALTEGQRQAQALGAKFCVGLNNGAPVTVQLLELERD